MDLQTIVSELKRERDRIDRAIAALDGTQTGSTATTTRAAKARDTSRRQSKRGHLTAAGRKRLSELMKKRWAERRRKASNGRKAAKALTNRS
jgi:hypothetical protein